MRLSLSTPVSSTPVMSTPVLSCSCFVYSCLSTVVFSTVQVQKCSLDRNVTSATYKLVFSNILQTYKNNKVTMNNNNQRQQCRGNRRGSSCGIVK